ncbi:MAG: hypothetical protein KAK04_02470, partial [Cyclobacteriaceae bacterium]|nr:hypothetical protein [Cyclobacteriaceae bacterium]
QVSFVYTKKEPRSAFRYRIKKGSGETGIRFVTLVAPYEIEIPKVKIRVVGDPTTGSSKLNLEILDNREIKYIEYDLEDK